MDTVGLYEPDTSFFFLKNEHSGGVADINYGFGLAGGGWLPIAGDWNGPVCGLIGIEPLLLLGVTGLFRRRIRWPAPKRDRGSMSQS